MAAGLHHPASTWHHNTDKPGCGTSAYQDFKGQDRERNEASQVLKQIEEVNGTALANLQPPSCVYRTVPFFTKLGWNFLIFTV